MRPLRTTQAPGAQDDRPIPPVRGRRAHAGPPADERVVLGSRPRRTQDPSGRRRTWSPRPRTVRAKVLALLMVPVVSLLALWGLATVTTAQEVSRLRQAERVDATVRTPVRQAVDALQAERKAALVQSAAPGDGAAATLETRAARTGAALDRLRMGEGHTVADTGGLPAGLATRMDVFLARADGLGPLRGRLLASPGPEPDSDTDRDSAYLAYTDAIGAAFGVLGALTGIQNAEIGPEARVLLELGRADEMLAREDVLLAAAARTGTLEGRALLRFTGAVEARRAFTETAAADLPAAERDAWQDLAADSAYRAVESAEDAVLAARPGAPAAQAVPADAWALAGGPVLTRLRAVEAAAADRLAGRSDPLASGLTSSDGAAVLFGFIAVVAALVISVRIGSGLVTELVSLRDSALAIARRELPRAMERLRAGEEIDVKAESPPRRPSQDEIGQVGEALDIVHRAALSAAVERAELASGIAGVFVNLARRSQVLVHRQLNLLDGMERRADDPNELADLFRLDHLTTRMRRHAESLIILSGAAPGRAWRRPVPLTQVVRAAVSEIEDYARVEVRRLADVSVTGVAVADLTHLLAELVENAAQFSPPHTKVRITGEPVGNGYAIEIEDRGLGMGAELLAQANKRIEQSEALDLFDSDRLGLFVVSRLSSRHRIKVGLRTSPYGGTTAVVLLPTALLHEDPPENADPGAPAPQAAAGEKPSPRAAVTGGGHRAAFPPPVAVPDQAPDPDPAETGEDASDTPPAPVTALRRRPRTPAAGRAAERGHPRSPLKQAAAQPPERSKAAGDDEELPRRVRQAHLVPQLRQGQAPPPREQRAGGGGGPAERTPEQVRDRMTAYRDGWRRGSGTAAVAPPTAPPAPGPAAHPIDVGDPG
ncbi:nitrate- and nitrite sensing domain-containing protein [Streptomyces sp. NBC_00102]|uniref:sensor histidine kinase n=1 Tax=Streptomyces sp. NBC_00102 TaxID=2975652 RepID=UPI00225532B6|nr:nitrate- and nitrite sensing domain-containing protein [Streptomyces sp. NBC_00102]MCX5401896.1 nitrate- and nitrite sensing domain-containing protein [Streptomyces sp. NBC_00102]